MAQTICHMHRATEQFLRWTRRLMGRADKLSPNEREEAPIYFLSGWPELPGRFRTAAVYRVLSTMSVRAVNRHWVASQTYLKDEQLEALLQHLRDQQVLQTQCSQQPGASQRIGEAREWPESSHAELKPANASMASEV